MPLVTVKSKFQVTIPARLRKGIAESAHAFSGHRGLIRSD